MIFKINAFRVFFGNDNKKHTDKNKGVIFTIKVTTLVWL